MMTQFLWKTIYFRSLLLLILFISMSQIRHVTSLAYKSSTGRFINNKFRTVRTVAAPMVAQSDRAFRQLVRQNGCDATYTQMIHAKNFVKSDKFRVNHLDVFPRDFSNELDRPVVVQLAGHSVDAVVSTALQITEIADGNLDGIDINLGCPQSIARKGRYGAFLFLEDECSNNDVICDMIRSLRKALPSDINVTAKIRIMENDNDDREDGHKGKQSQIYAYDKLKQKVLRMQDAGMDAITVHGRTVKENKTAVRECNWDAIRTVVDTLNIPVIANGGIEFSSDVQRCLDATGAAGVMSSESLLENPALFAPNAKDDYEITAEELVIRQFDLADQYLSLAREYPPLPGVLGEYGGHASVKGHLFKILYRMFNEHVDLRDELGDRRVYNINQSSEIIHKLRQRYFDVNNEFKSELKHNHYSKWSSWYRRHRTPADENAEEMSVEEKKAEIRERIMRMKKTKNTQSNKLVFQS